MTVTVALAETIEIRRDELAALIAKAADVVDRVNLDETQHGGLLSRDSLLRLGGLKHELSRWRTS